MKNRLRMLRVERNLSQAELAKSLGVSRQTVNALEMGKYDPSLPLAFKVARLFGTSIESVFLSETLETPERKIMFERFTQKAVQVIMLAQEESRRLGHNFVGTEQVLLGLIAENTGYAAEVLKAAGIELESVRAEVEKIIGRGDNVFDLEIPFTPRGKLVLEYAMEESRRLSQDFIGTEHLLLGVLRIADGVAVKALANLGINLQELAKQVFRKMGVEGAISPNVTPVSNPSLSSEDESIQSPPDFTSGEVSSRFCASLFAWVEPRQLGYVLSSRVGYQLPNGEILQPHCSFVSRERLKRVPRTYPEVAPEMVMEVKSAFDRLIPIQKKIQSFLQLQWGIRVGILIDPDQRSVSVYRLGAAVNVLEDGEVLTLPELLPNWELPVSDLWTGAMRQI
jgi:DNA-binding XRE family transcriptional regulator/Uma2 family endonuclease